MNSGQGRQIRSNRRAGPLEVFVGGVMQDSLAYNAVIKVNDIIEFVGERVLGPRDLQDLVEEADRFATRCKIMRYRK